MRMEETCLNGWSMKIRRLRLVVSAFAASSSSWMNENLRRVSRNCPERPGQCQCLLGWNLPLQGRDQNEQRE